MKFGSTLGYMYVQPRNYNIHRNQYLVLSMMNIVNILQSIPSKILPAAVSKTKKMTNCSTKLCWKTEGFRDYFLILGQFSKEIYFCEISMVIFILILFIFPYLYQIK